MAVLTALLKAARRFGETISKPKQAPPKTMIGVALGGGFARGIAHIGVLRTLEKHKVPIHAIAGVSAGSIIAAAYASGSTVDEIESIARRMKFRDVATWTVSRLGFAGSEKMTEFLRKLLKVHLFEQMRTPLAVVATDLVAGHPRVFRDHGDVCVPIRASCAYPGLFLPIKHDGKLFVDGAVTMEIPAAPLRAMTATHVISVSLPTLHNQVDPANVFSVVNRSFQIFQQRAEGEWRAVSDLVVEPDVAHIGWDGFVNAAAMIKAGEVAAEKALPTIEAWLNGTPKNGL